ncbi:MAG: selenocysteine-specific translation elongation factor [Acidobacteriota bacterium]
MNIVVGTAGHIDHGKTALIRALTGTDTDRLPEEKQRGITIDLGFAEMHEADVRIDFVDVPGHERFIKNMLAGASGIDIVLFVVAADEGVMPQTREHLDICRFLKIGSGVIALTKTDKGGPELTEAARLEIAELVSRTFLENAPIVAISSKTGDGIDRLKKVLLEAARSAPARDHDRAVRLPIDRSFSVKGFGAVVTGTLLSGRISEADELELLPGGKRVRVRGVQTHSVSIASAAAGQRTAVNLSGVDHREVSRGMVLGEAGTFRPIQILDTEIEISADHSAPIKRGQRVRIHIGTAEILGRIFPVGPVAEISPGETGFVQLRLESPVVAVAGDRFIIRSYSPPITVAGGKVLAAGSRRPRDGAEARRQFLQRLSLSLGDHRETLRLFVFDSGLSGVSLDELRAATGLKREIIESGLAKGLTAGVIVDAAGIYLSIDAFNSYRSEVLKEIERSRKREPLARGLSLEYLRERVFGFVRPAIPAAVISDLESKGEAAIDRDVIRIPEQTPDLSVSEQAAIDQIRAIFVEAGLRPPPLTETLAQTGVDHGIGAVDMRKLFQILLDSGEMTGIGGELFIPTPVLNELVGRLRQEAAAAEGQMIDVALFKRVSGLSRKFAIPLLEYFDRSRITTRSGDKRIVH